MPRMFCIGAAYTAIVRQSSGYAPGIGEGRVRSLKSLFFVTIVLFFVSMIVALRKERGNMRGRRRLVWKLKHAWKSIARCSDRWKNRTRGMGGKQIVDFMFILLSLPLVS